MKIHLSIVVLTHNRCEAVLRCLRSLADQVVAGDELVVVVNGSTDGTAQSVRSEFPAARVCELTENVGCPGGRNMGIQAANHDWVLCVDDDATARDGFVDNAKLAVARWPDAAVIGGEVSDEFHALSSSARPDRRAMTFSGGVAVLHRRTFLDLGGYPVDGLREGEERDYSIRVIGKGGVIIRTRDLVLDHHPIETVQRRQEIIGNIARNSTLTSLRHMPFPIALMLIIMNSARLIRVAARHGAIKTVIMGVWEGIGRMRDVRREAQVLTLGELWQLHRYRRSLR